MYFVGLVIQCYTADKLTAVLHCIHVGFNRFYISPFTVYLPSQLVDPKRQMLDNLIQTVHNHHNHKLLCKAKV